jgi:hypothetical protein
MAIGDQNDILSRLIRYLPVSWFDGDSNPIRDGVLSGLAAGHAAVYSMLAYVRGQTRIKTTSEGFLDLISQDYFGGALPRLAGENDAHFLIRIQLNLLRERATREGVVKVLVDLTGFTPVIVEPQNPADCGGYGAPSCGYGAAGYYGSMLLPYQGFVHAFRPSTSGIPNMAGYGNVTGYAPGGYGSGLIEYGSLSMIQGAVTDADIYAAVASVIPEGTIAWMEISNPSPSSAGAGFGAEGFGVDGFGE